jgi:hypothetical protein
MIQHAWQSQRRKTKEVDILSLHSPGSLLVIHASQVETLSKECRSCIEFSLPVKNAKVKNETFQLFRFFLLFPAAFEVLTLMTFSYLCIVYSETIHELRVAKVPSFPRVVPSQVRQVAGSVGMLLEACSTVSRLTLFSLEQAFH